MIYIGIDNGLSGGVVAIGPCAGTAPILVAKMPVHLVDDAREIDTGALHGMLGELDGPATVGVEECPMHSRDKLAMRSMALSYGLILGVLERFKARGWTIHRVKAGNSKAGWQRGMLGGNIPQGQTKKQAAVAAGSIWPEETWIFPRCTKPHDGCIDAALIAEWLRRRTERNAFISDKTRNLGRTIQRWRGAGDRKQTGG